MNGCRTFCFYLGFIILINLHLTLQTEFSPGYYVLTAPTNIYSGRRFAVAISIFDMFSNNFELSLSGPSVNISVSIFIVKFQKCVYHVFDLPRLVNGSYFLKLKGVTKLKFETTRQLNWQSGTMNYIKIHTPKVLYRPGQLLQFSVLYHDEALNGIRPESTAIIWIEDSKGNRIQVYSQFTVNSGIFTSQIRLGRQPNLGRWRICSQNGDIEECADIKVDQYELSPFELDIEAPTEVDPAAEAFDVTVSARSFTGGPVDGNVILNIEALTKAELTAEPVLVKWERPVENGNASVTVLLSSFNPTVNFDIPQKLRIVANFCQKYSKKNVSITKDVIIKDINEVFLDAIETRTPFKQNKIYIEKFGNPFKTMQKITFNVDRKVTFAVCVVMFNGLLLAAQRVNSNLHDMNYEVYIQITLKMWPLAHVFLFTKEEGENPLLLARKIINVVRTKYEQIVIEAPSEIIPGNKTTFRINAVENSYVALYAVDSRVLQLGGNPNDIDQKYFDAKKLGLLKMSSDTSNDKGQFQHSSGLILISNVDEILDVTDKSKLWQTIQRTDQIIPDAPECQKIENKFLETLVEKRTMEENSCCVIPKMEKVPNDVWIYDSIKRSKPGWQNWKTIAPTDISNWRLSAFAMDPISGITLLMPQPFMNLKSRKSLFLSLNVPYSIQVDEVLELFLNCHNQDDTEVNYSLQLSQDDDRFELLKNNDNVFAFKELKLNAKAHKTVVVHFNLHALRPGPLKLTFTARSATSWDRITQEIMVRSDYNVLPHQVAYHKEIDTESQKFVATIELPHQPTADGIKCFITTNIIALKLSSPSVIVASDNAEQLISKMMSIYYLWKHVKFDKWISRKYIQFMEDQLNDGFQSLLRLRESDGGFSYYPNTAKPGCSLTWLTAYALQLFNLLERTHVQIDAGLFERSEQFLLNRTAADGSFVESCGTHGRRQISPLELTIEVLNVLQISKEALNLKQSQNWRDRQLEAKPDDFLMTKHYLGRKTRDWQVPSEDPNISWMEHRRNVENAGHKILMRLRRTSPKIYPGLYNWLMAQYLQDHDYFDCYECSVALPALYKYAKTQLNEYLEEEVKLAIWTDPAEKKFIKINTKNFMKEQQVQLQTNQKTIYLRADNAEELIIRCKYDYVPELEPQLYSVKVWANKQEELKIKFCVKRLELDRKYYMGTIVELQLPSGYVLDKASVEKLLEDKNVNHANGVDENTKLFVSLKDILPKISVCLTVHSQRSYAMKKLQPTLLIVYDTNSMEKREGFFYSITSRTL